MSLLNLSLKHLNELADIDNSIRTLNDRKIAVLFEALGITITPEAFARMLTWELIMVTVPDKQMAVQLNKLCGYVPYLKFVVDEQAELFTVFQGAKARRVWKER